MNPSPSFLEPSLIKTIELVTAARVKGISKEKLLSSAESRREKKPTCRLGSNLPFPTYVRWLQDLAASLDLGDLSPSPSPTNEDMRTGLKLVTILSYCSHEAEGALFFLEQLVHEESPASLLLALVNTIQVEPCSLCIAYRYKKVSLLLLFVNRS